MSDGKEVPESRTTTSRFDLNWEGADVDQWTPRMQAYALAAMQLRCVGGNYPEKFEDLRWWNPSYVLRVVMDQIMFEKLPEGITEENPIWRSRRGS